jgi:hypothetical protein
LPKSAYTRAIPVLSLSNIEVFSLDPLDVAILKSDRMAERDEQDILKIFAILRPTKDQLKQIFSDYEKLLKGNRTSIDNIRENFEQLVLLLLDIATKK